MALVKRNGQLFEEKDDSLMGRVNQLGTSTPTSPAGAAGLGVSPDSAKMVGSGAQRQNAIRQATAPKQTTLAGQQRLQGPMEATTADQQAQQKAQQIQQLGAMGTRVQSQIENMIGQATQGLQLGQAQADDATIMQTLGLSQADIANDPAGFNQVKGLIEGYANSQDPAQREQMLVDLVNAGIPKSDIYRLTGFLEDGSVATGDAIAGAMANEMTLGSLDLEGLGFANKTELATALGVPEQDIDNMSVEQFTQAVENLQQEQYTEIEQLRSELAGLPSGSARAQKIKSQLRELGDVGRTGAERMVSSAVQDLRTAGNVTLGGQEYTIDELLDDNTFSSVIETYMQADQETRDAMFPPEQFGQLRQWIDDNEKALAAVVSDAKGDLAAFETTNREWEGLSETTGLDQDLINTLIGSDLYDPNKAITSADLATIKTNLQSSGIGQIAMNGTNPALIKALDADSINMMKDWDSAKVEEAYNTAYNINTDPDLGNLIPGLVDENTKFIDLDNPAIAAKLAQAQKVNSDLSKVPEATKARIMNNPTTTAAIMDGTIDSAIITEKNANAFTHQDVIDSFKDGTLNASNAYLLDNFDTDYPEYATNKQIADRIDRSYTGIKPGQPGYDDMLDNMLDNILGPGDHVEGIKEAQKQAQWMANMGMPEGQTLLAKYSQLLDAEYLAKASDVDLAGFLAGQRPAVEDLQKVSSNAFSNNPEYKSLYDAYANDGKVDFKEISQDKALLDRLYGPGADDNLRKSLGAPAPELLAKNMLSNPDIDPNTTTGKQYLSAQNTFEDITKGKSVHDYTKGTFPYDQELAKLDSWAMQKEQTLQGLDPSSILYKTLSKQINDQKSRYASALKTAKSRHDTAHNLYKKTNQVKENYKKAAQRYTMMGMFGGQDNRPTKTIKALSPYGVPMTKQVPIPFDELTPEQRGEYAKQFGFANGLYSIDMKANYAKSKLPDTYIPKEYRK